MNAKMTKYVIVCSRSAVTRDQMVVNVNKMQDARAGIACRVSAESVPLLIASQVVRLANFAKGPTAYQLMSAVQSRATVQVVNRVMVVHLGTVCRVSAENVRLLIAAQVAHRLSFAKGPTTFKLTCAVQGRAMDRLVLPVMHAIREYVPEDTVAYAHQALIVDLDTNATTTFQRAGRRSAVHPPEVGSTRGATPKFHWWGEYELVVNFQGVHNNFIN